MVDADGAERLLLRAELTHNGRSVIAHTMSISEDAVFVQTDEQAYNGDRVEVRLSFPGLVTPLCLETHVVACRSAGGPGEPGGWWLAFVFFRDEDRERLLSLLARADATGADLRGSSEDQYRVLLVEDSTLTREVFEYGVKKYFEGRSGRVSVDLAQDAEAAWSLLEDTSYDLVIVDYFLPRLNGDRLIARLRDDTRTANVPVVAVSVGGVEAREATLGAGADLFLNKPVVLRDLFATLERLTATRERV